jgi:hypothetical protein
VPSTDQTALRPREEIQAVRDRRQTELDVIVAKGLYGEATFRGNLAAFDWVLGVVAEAPLSGQVGVDVSDQWAITREQIRATEMLQGRAPRDRRGNGYISGVEHALMWVLYESVTPM